MKRCYDYDVEKPPAAFHTNKDKKDGLSLYCRDCSTARARDWRKRVPRDPQRAAWRKSKQAAYNRRYAYGVDPCRYTQMLVSSNGNCWLCGGSPGAKGLVIDHDHSCCPMPKSCGACVRGLLCTSCNAALGHMDDSTERLRRAIRYLDRGSNAQEERPAK